MIAYMLTQNNDFICDYFEVGAIYEFVKWKTSFAGSEFGFVTYPNEYMGLAAIGYKAKIIYKVEILGNYFANKEFIKTNKIKVLEKINVNGKTFYYKIDSYERILAYDNNANLTSKIQKLNGKIIICEDHIYGENNNLIKIQYNDKDFFEAKYDDSGKVISKFRKGGEPFETEFFKYNEDGKLVKNIIVIMTILNIIIIQKAS